jgi:cytidylate kinase
MNLKQIITESVLINSIEDIQEELKSIKQSLHEQLIIEGVDDPGILKCVFMAGGPGSGKSFTAMDIFGIDKTLVSSFSTFGLKVVNSDSAFESLLKKNGIDPKKLADIEKENPELWDKLTKEPGSVRGQAKKITAKQKAFYEAGRLGMIIDGTGHDYAKIQKQKKHAESLGYDCYMVFVNTSLQVALERNKNRDRILPEDLVTQSWKDVQENLGKFQNLFSGDFRIVDNTVYKPISKPIQKAVNKFIQEPIQNPIGKQWVKMARELKNRNLIKK